MHNGSVVRRRMLGRRLRLLRERAGLTLEAAAPALDWSTSTLSRIETGQQAPHVHGVRNMLDLYGVGGAEWDELITLTREVRQKGWWKAYGIGDQSYVGFEAEASRVHEFAVTFLPGLLQTADYSRALFAASPVPRTPQELRDDVAVRMIRQRRLTSPDDRLELTAIVEETALLRPVGGPEVMREQLRHLAEAAELDSVTLHVLSASVGAHTGMASGFHILSFGRDLGEPDIAYVEHAIGALLIEKEADVALARLKFDRLRSAAHSPSDSLALIRGAAER